jgi:hypothetical protein
MANNLWKISLHPPLKEKEGYKFRRRGIMKIFCAGMFAIACIARFS